MIQLFANLLNSVQSRAGQIKHWSSSYSPLCSWLSSQTKLFPTLWSLVLPPQTNWSRKPLSPHLLQISSCHLKLSPAWFYLPASIHWPLSAAGKDAILPPLYALCLAQSRRWSVNLRRMNQIVLHHLPEITRAVFGGLQMENTALG